MNQNSRRLIQDVFDYSGNKMCNLYDSSVDSSGQAYDVFVCIERNGWRELKFSLPSVLVGPNGSEPNYRQNYLKADYRIRQIDKDGTDWFQISEPRVVHQSFSKNVSVVAGHISQQLKTKNLGLEFSDEEGNNVGTAAELLQTILAGTGWTPGSISTFYEKDMETEKKRSLSAPAKTGAFKLITMMCDLFDAKPVFHGDGRLVDIIPMNPFTEPEEGCLPDVAGASGVIELNYGTNVSGITRVLNTENLVTKLYAYGAYGDIVSGYCGINEGTHKEFVVTLTESIASGETCIFYPEGYPPLQFVASTDMVVGTQLIWSTFDPASMSYIWNSTDEIAYKAISADVIVYTDHAMSAQTTGGYILTGNSHLAGMIEQLDVTNSLSFQMDFTYYQKVGLFSDAMLQQLARYQRSGVHLLEESNTAMQEYLDLLSSISNIVGSVNYCKLNVSEVSDSDGYIQLMQNDVDPVLYRTDYEAKQKNRFKWTPAITVDDHGDPKNSTASVLYVIHNTTPVTWEKLYIQNFDGGKVYSQDGDEQALIRSITLWQGSKSIVLTSSEAGDAYYLFEMNNVNGLLGSWEASDEAKMRALNESTKVVTLKHPVYFLDNETPLPQPDDKQINGYAWTWKYTYGNTDMSQLYFYYSASKDTADNESSVNNQEYLNQWVPVFFSGTPPQRSDSTPAYWYNWGDLTGWARSTQYIWKDSVWKPAIGTEFGTAEHVSFFETNDIDLTVSYDIEDLWSLFPAVYWSCIDRDKLYQGLYNFYTVEITDDLLSSIYPPDGSEEYAYPEELEAGNYYIADQYGVFHVFTTEENLSLHSKLQYDAHNRWITQINAEGVATTLEVKDYRQDNVMYNNDQKDLIVIEKEHFIRLSPTVPSGSIRGIVEFISSFQRLSDSAYEESVARYTLLQQEYQKLENATIDVLGDTYREGWWQSNDYVDGDESKLYADALDNQKEIAKPEATYTITFLDRYGSNVSNEYAASSVQYNLPYPDIDIMSAAHLIDMDIDLNIWAYFDKINKCYDKPWQTTVAINTKLSTMMQHSFTDVLTNIANVTSEIKGKTSVLNRAGIIAADGTLSTTRLEGAIDAAKLKIFGVGSSWYTDESGNMVFVAADGASAMTLTGNGFAIADSKDEWGVWNWRTFGTGKGFSADEINTGFLSADRIQARSIGSGKLEQIVQDAVSWYEGAHLNLTDEAITATVANRQTAGDTDESAAFQASIVKQTSDAVSVDFQKTTNDLDARLKSAESLTDAANNWFKFSSAGFEIRGTEADGNPSAMYTQQTNEKYSFYGSGIEQTSISGEGMRTDKVEVITELRLGDLVGLMDEDNNITWIYNKKN